MLLILFGSRLQFLARFGDVFKPISSHVASPLCIALHQQVHARVSQVLWCSLRRRRPATRRLAALVGAAGWAGWAGCDWVAAWVAAAEVWDVAVAAAAGWWATTAGGVAVAAGQGLTREPFSAKCRWAVTQRWLDVHRASTWLYMVLIALLGVAHAHDRKKFGSLINCRLYILRAESCRQMCVSQM